MPDISEHDDVIDSRDVIARFGELSDRDLYPLGTFTQDETDEYIALRDLIEDGQEDEWRYGVTLIRDSYWVQYAQEYAEETGAFSSTTTWPFTCIDWEEAASDLQQDYSPVTFAGVTYWVR